MGGNIFQGINRIDRKDYDSLEHEVISMLGTSIFSQSVEYYNLLRSNLLQSIKFYRKKETFGDLDIIVNKDWLVEGWEDILASKFNLGEDDISVNVDNFSFKYKNFQVDLIVTPNEHFWTSVDYFAWNDLGNLIGRIASRHGIRFGHKGSHIIVSDGSQKLGEILITKITKDILEHLDLDYFVWERGFDTMEDAFEWIVKSKYFNPEIYSYENRNHASRTRDKKRKNYADFLVWLEGRPDVNKYPYEELEEKGGYKIYQPFFGMICEKFPHVSDDYMRMTMQYEYDNAFKLKFNGEIVGKITNLKNKELGDFIKFCRAQFDNNPNLKRTFTFSFDDRNCQMVIESLYTHYKDGFEYGKYPLEVVRKKVMGDKYFPLDNIYKDGYNPFIL